MDRLIFSTRGLVVVAALVLALAPGLFPWLSRADAWSYGQVAALKPGVPAARVVLSAVPVSADGRTEWLAAAAVRLDQLAGADAAAVVVPAAWLPALNWTAEGRALQQRIRQHGAVLGVAGADRAAWHGRYPVLPVAATGLQPYLKHLPRVALLHARFLLETGAALPLLPAVHPVGTRTAAYPLVWPRADGASRVADLAGVLAGGGTPSGWQPDQGLTLADGAVATDPAGVVFVPPHSRQAITTWSGDGAVPELAGRVAIVAPPGIAEALAAATAALLAGETAHTPYWASAGGVLLVLLAGLYAAFMVPRLNAFPALLLTALLGFGVAGVMAGVYLRFGLWLAWTPVLVVLLIGHPLGMLARLPARRLARLDTEREHALRRLGAYQVEHGDYQDAFSTLRRCRPVEEVLEQIYRCGSELARKRQYEQARAVFAWLQERRPGYRDVRAHLESLRTSPAGGADPGQTVVIAEGVLARPLIGRYEVLRELGRGATGVVYLGRDPKIGREVAIKTLAFSQFDPEELETFKTRFAREAEAAGRLSHPNIVTIYDVGEEADLAFIAMDYAAGRTLAAHTAPRELLPVGDVLGVIAEVAEALDYAHGRGIVHRDIKPANIIYDADSGRVKVTDFGIARVMDSARTRTGSIVGTPSYMAPEQLTGETVDGRSDIFSLGVTLYQLLTGQAPFRGENLAGIAYQITTAKPIAVRTLRPELPVAVGRIVSRALHKSPDKRYQTAGEMAEALRKAAVRARRVEETASHG